MAQRKSVRGSRSAVVWLAIVLVLVLAIALAMIVFIIGPQQQLRQQAHATTEARQDEVERLYAAGIALQNAGDCGKAAESLTQAISLEPGYKDAQTRLAETLACHQAAEATATAQVIAMAQATAEAQTTATANARDLAQAAAATATAETAAAIEAAYQRGLGYYNLERWADAKTAFEEVFAMAPTYKDVQTRLAEVGAKLAETRKLTPTIAPIPTVTSVPPTTTHGPTPTTTPTLAPALIFFDDFDAGPKPDWEVLSGTWGMAGGKYTMIDISGGSVAGISLVGDPSWRDYVIEVDVTGLYSPGDESYYYGNEAMNRDDLRMSRAAILVRAQGNSDYVGLIVGAEHIEWGTLIDDRWSVVSGTLVDGYGAEGTHLRIEVRGDVYVAYADGKMITSFSDGRFPGGRAGIWLRSTDMDTGDWRSVPKIDNFKVTRLD